MAWWYIVFKYAVSSAVIIAVSETAKRSDRLGGLLAALPLVTVLTLVWLQMEQQPATMISNHAWYTLWYAIPTLPMFAAFPTLHDRYAFWLGLLYSTLLSLLMVPVMVAILYPFGVRLL